MTKCDILADKRRQIVNKHLHFQSNGQKAWVVAVNMGYGHQRAAYPLREMAQGRKVISANNYPGIPESDKKIWENSRHFYEFISRFKNVPIIGKYAFDLFDLMQSIPSFYPKRDLSNPSLQVHILYHYIRKKGWGKHLIAKLAKNPLPIITTFFTVGFMADEHGYPGEIYVLATDTDVARAWVPLQPSNSKIKYFAPNVRVYKRLKAYGICSDNIYLTGFPLPHENIGDNDKILKQDLSARVVNLDPLNKYISKYKGVVNRHLEPYTCVEMECRPPTIMFAVGGAGAQRDIGVMMASSLKEDIKHRRIQLVLVAGIHNELATYFKEQLKSMGLRGQIGKGIEIIHASNKQLYFKEFNKVLRRTDILWTKPSELSFYTALGIPIIMSPPIGSQEKFNRKWLFTVGSGVDQENPKYAHQWLFDWIDSGWFAEAAMEGYLEAPRHGTYNIQKVIAHKTNETKEILSVLQF